MRFDGIRFVVAEDQRGVSDVISDRSGGLWWASTGGGGLIRRTGDRSITWTSRDGLPSDLVQEIFQDRDGTVWIGTTEGLARLRGGKLVTFGALAHPISAFAQGPDGALWIGTDDAGVARLTDSLTFWTAHDGLPDDHVTALAVDHPGALASRDGRLWFPTIRGLAMVDPRRARDNERRPPVVLEEVLAGGRPITWKGEGPVELTPDRRKLEVHYTARPRAASGRSSLRSFSRASSR